MKTLAIFATVAAAQISAEDLVGLLNDNELTALAKAVSGQEALVQSLTTDEDGFTVFAPPNDVLEPAVAAADPKSIPNILSYHTSADVFNPKDAELPAVIETGLKSEGLSGAQVVIATADGDDILIQHGAGKAKVTNSVTADPSIVHVVDAVLIPPEAPSKVASGNDDLSSLVKALTDENLVSTIDEAKDITIFAPNNAAFAALSETPSNLTDVLVYHVVTGVAYSPKLEGTKKYETLQGATVEVKVEDGGVTVNGAKVLVADVLTSNGVVHVIDGVLTPEDGSEPDSDTGKKPASAGKAVLSISIVVSLIASLF